MNAWHREFLASSSDGAELKKKWGVQRCNIELERFLALEPAAKALVEVTDKTFRAHEIMK